MLSVYELINLVDWSVCRYIDREKPPSTKPNTSDLEFDFIFFNLLLNKNICLRWSDRTVTNALFECICIFKDRTAGSLCLIQYVFNRPWCLINNPWTRRISGFAFRSVSRLAVLGSLVFHYRHGYRSSAKLLHFRVPFFQTLSISLLFFVIQILVNGLFPYKHKHINHVKLAARCLPVTGTASRIL